MMTVQSQYIKKILSFLKINHRNHCPRNLGMFQKVVIKKISLFPHRLSEPTPVCFLSEQPEKVDDFMMRI